MPSLLSGSLLRKGGSGDFIELSAAQPQLPPTDTTQTGFTLVTDNLLRTSYSSSLGFVQFSSATMYSTLPSGMVKIKATGTSFFSTATTSGNLVVEGGIGVGGNMTIADDIVVSGLRIGTGFEGINNLVFRGSANTNTTGFEDGQNNVAIGYDTLIGITGTNKVIAIGRFALSSGTLISDTIAIGDSALKKMGTNNYPFISTITNIIITPSKNIQGISNTIPAVVTATSHNLTTGTQILITEVNGISTSSSGTSVINNKAWYVKPLNSSTFELYANKSLTVPSNAFTTTYNGSVINLTTYTGSGTIIIPIYVNVQKFINTGSHVYLDGIVGTTELNNDDFYVDNINSTTIALFHNSTLVQAVNGTSFNAYINSGTVNEFRSNDNNIAIGNNVAPELQNGEYNFFFGNNLVTQMITGSNNTFIGHNVGGNLSNVNGTIALGGDNLVDNRDNQVNIGSVFYYDGRGNTDINSDVRLGLGTTSTSTDSGALVVLGGAAITGAIYSEVSGNAFENNLVYSPKVTVTTATPPPNPRVGDFWLDSSVPAYLQYIRDGTSTFWIQINGI